MKHKLIIISILMGWNMMAYVTFPFPGWLSLEQNSKDIIIGQCRSTPNSSLPTNGVVNETRGWVDSDITIVKVLKGATNIGSVQLKSEFCPLQGEYYLIFANYDFGSYQAFEKYRVVPLGLHFATNSLSGVSANDAIEMLLRERLRKVHDQIKEEQQEEQRLEEFLNSHK